MANIFDIFKEIGKQITKAIPKTAEITDGIISLATKSPAAAAIKTRPIIRKIIPLNQIQASTKYLSVTPIAQKAAQWPRNIRICTATS